MPDCCFVVCRAAWRPTSIFSLFYPFPLFLFPFSWLTETLWFIFTYLQATDLSNQLSLVTVMVAFILTYLADYQYMLDKQFGDPGERGIFFFKYWCAWTHWDPKPFCLHEEFIADPVIGSFSVHRSERTNRNKHGSGSYYLFVLPHFLCPFKIYLKPVVESLNWAQAERKFAKRTISTSAIWKVQNIQPKEWMSKKGLVFEDINKTIPI